MKTIILLLLASVAWAVPTPILYYSDITSGPNTGSRNNNGAIVCVYGVFFGSTQGSSTLTIGGGAAAEIIWWGDNVHLGKSQVCFSLGAAAATGNIVMTTSGGTSNGLPFTIRSAPIYWVGDTFNIGGSTLPSDSNSGAFATPFATIAKGVSQLTSASGALVYVRGTVPAATGVVAYSSTVVLNNAGTSSAPLSLIANWPGDAQPVIGEYNNPSAVNGIYNFNGDHYAIVGFALRGYGSAIQMAFGQTDWRLVNNTIECPAGNGQAGCLYALFDNNNPSLTQSYKIYGNELKNIGCGFGPTGGADDSTTLNGQQIYFPCATSAVQSGTLASTDGITLTLSGATFNTSNMNVGDHLLVDTTGTGVYESSIVSSVGSTTFVLSSNSFSTVSFSGRAWKFTNHMSSKLYHTTYFGTDTNGVDFAWNSIHNNSSFHGFNVHSTPGSSAEALLSANAGTPGTVTFTSTSPGLFVSGQYIEIVGNNVIASAGYYVGSPGIVGSVETVSLYNDAALTSPYTVTSGGTASGTIAWHGFSQFNITAHNNTIDHQNGACMSLANVSPARGTVAVYNNVLSNCGTGPHVFGDAPEHYAAFYPIDGPDNPTNNLYASGTASFYNNTIYNGGSFATVSSSDIYAAINEAVGNGALYWNFKNNIVSQPNGIPFFVATGGNNQIVGSNNIWFGTDSSTIPPMPTGNITSDPLFVNTAYGNFTLGYGSPAVGAGTSSLAPANDILGHPQSSPPSIGAYNNYPFRTYYVRTDGGTFAQCTGLVDAAYGGSGSSQPCGWRHPFVALSAPLVWRIASGDHLLIENGSYQISYYSTDALPLFNGYSGFDIHLPPLPGGLTAMEPTVLAGINYQSGCATRPELWSANGVLAIITMTGGFEQLGCMQFDDHSSCIYVNPNVRCDDSGYTGAWGKYGVFFNDYSAHDITLTDVNIHGFGAEGIHGSGSNMTLTNVTIRGNGLAGWNLDEGTDIIVNFGHMNLTNVLVEWNGCGEVYDPGFPDNLTIAHCWGQQTGGYGDGVSPWNSVANWVINKSTFRYNTQEGFDVLYNDYDFPMWGSVTVDQSRFYGNSGNQLKASGTLTFTNSFAIGNCTYISKQSFSDLVGQTTDIGGNYVEGDICRATGSAIVNGTVDNGASVIANSYVSGEGLNAIELRCTGSEPQCGTNSRNSSVTIVNSIVEGAVSTYDNVGGWGLAVGQHSNYVYSEAGSFAGLEFIYMNNNIWFNGFGVSYDGDAPTIPTTCTYGAASFCASPGLVNDVFDPVAINAHLTSGSIARGAGTGAYTNHDMDGVARPASAPDIGPYQYVPGAPTPGGGTFFLLLKGLGIIH